MSANVRQNRQTVTVTNPNTSIERGARSSRDSCTAQAATRTAITPIGTLMKKIDCQPTFSTSKPPANGPIAVARPLTLPQMPMARPRSGPSNVAVMIARVMGNMIDAPMPWMPRATSSAFMCERPPTEMPPDSPQRSEPSVKTVRPAMKTRLRPKMSPSRPAVTRNTARVSA